MSRRRIIKDKDGNRVEIDQDKIDAALSGAVTTINGEPIVAVSDMGGDDIPTENEDVKEPETDVKSTVGDAGNIARPQSEFLDACYNMTIDAKQCFYQSNKNEDKSVMEYIRSINKKIYDETQNGGYSTNVQFRVTPQDWVNISHITGWYKSRGFQIENFESTQAPYGKDVGCISYHFTISWAVV